MARRLFLVPAGPPAPDDDLLRWLGDAVQHSLGLAPERDAPLPLLEQWRAPDGACSSNAVVDELIRRRPPDGDHPPRDWTLAVTAADLRADQRDFVFGEAALGGAWAVVSTARLHPVDHDREQLRRRLLTEALHELGHVAGLPHCPRPACALAFSPDVAGVDRKNPEFCPVCRSALDAELALDRPLRDR